MRLRVSDNRRFLVHENNTPFFYLGDTAWELFHRLSREQADRYLETRARQQFTVIQATVLAEHGYDKPNPYGDFPLVNNDPARPVEAYMRHVDYIVDKAASLSLWTGMLPTWGDKWNKKWGMGPEIFTPDNARAWGEYLGKRYKDKPILWILGGDRPVENDTHRAIIRNMAAGLAAGDGGAHLKTFHPQGQQTSAQYFHEADWLDFNMYQTGHTRNRDSYNSIAQDYARQPAKPCLDAEPGYEDHPIAFKAENGYLNAYDVRKYAYWDLFAGACGHTYGCHDIWQFLGAANFPPVTSARTDWQKALVLPGAEQMRYARQLIESRSFLSRIPDQSLIVSGQGEGGDHIQATRDAQGRYAFVYFPSGKPAMLDLDKLSGSMIRATWYDPRTGAAGQMNDYPRGKHLFAPPVDKPAHAEKAANTAQTAQTDAGEGQDWVLLLDSKDALHAN